MLSTDFRIFIPAMLALAIASTGCDRQPAADGQQPVAVSGPPPATDHDHDHDHGDEHQGPHDGHVIELGRNHEYHAEIVEQEQDRLVSVYILGKDMEELSIDANEITMSLLVDGTPTTFRLVAANPNSGTASRFDAVDSALFEALHEGDSTGKLRATIDGTPYVANMEHHDHGHAHDDGDNHEGHDHEGHDHAGHDHNDGDDHAGHAHGDGHDH